MVTVIKKSDASCSEKVDAGSVQFMFPFPNRAADFKLQHAIFLSKHVISINIFKLQYFFHLA